MAELGGEVLMDEKNVHALALSLMGANRCRRHDAIIPHARNSTSAAWLTLEYARHRR